MCDRYPDVGPGACRSRCEFITDNGRLPDADAVIVHLPTAPPLDEIGKRSGQTWVAFSMESEVTVPRMADPMAMAWFDLELSYRRTADVWIPYVGRESLPGLLEPPTPKTEPYPVAHFQSNPFDRSGRNAYVRELIPHIKIASYGTVFPTMPNASTITTRDARPAVCARHKFTLAFENTIAVDYVTDKLFDVWIAGSVPVYLGAPNVADFAPPPHSFIDVSNFGGPQELSQYLNYLDCQDDEYGTYLDWKRTGPDPRFLAMLETVPHRPFCRIAELVHARRAAAAASAFTPPERRRWPLDT
jgi:hypothetical protein